MIVMSRNSIRFLSAKFFRHVAGACCAIFICSICSTSLAAELPKALKIDIGGYDSDATSCNLVENNTEGAVSAALRYNRIERSESVLDPHIIVRLNVIDTKSDTCIWSMRVAVVEYQYIQFRYLSKPIFSVAQLCSQVYVGRTNRMDVVSEYNENVKVMFDNCLNEIQQIK